jgi:hypothetical protein
VDERDCVEVFEAMLRENPVRCCQRPVQHDECGIQRCKPVMLNMASSSSPGAGAGCERTARCNLQFWQAVAT